jgi:hypothetical protein
MKLKIQIFCLFAFFLLAGSVLPQKHFISSAAYLKTVNERFLAQKKLAEKRSGTFWAFETGLNTEEEEALKFLYAFMPLSDLADYDSLLFLKLTSCSLKARDEFQWGNKIPEEVFRHFVLPYRVNNECIDTARLVFYNELKNRVKNLTMKQAALEVNHWCREKVTYKPTDERTISPLGLINSTFGRCGEESTFLVTALRAISIPARQVYVPRWSHCDDNHAWVEVWIDGKWHYMGACEPEAELNTAWFTRPAERAMLVHTKVFGEYNGPEEVIVKTPAYSVINVLKNYADVKNVKIKIVTKNNKPLPGACVEIKVFNYAEFSTIAKITADKKGECKFTTGYGDLLVWCAHDSLFGFKRLKAAEKSVTVKLNKLNGVDFSEDIDMVPPKEKIKNDSLEPKNEENLRRLKYEDSLRGDFIRGFMDSLSAVQLAASAGLPADTVWYFIKHSMGNWREISGFIKGGATYDKKRTIGMLARISEKDLRDVKSGVLMDHLVGSSNRPSNFITNDSLFFEKYILAPRVANEKLTAYRLKIQEMFPLSFVLKMQRKSSVVRDWINENIKLDTVNNYYNVPLTPLGVLELGICDRHSRDVLYVSLCRSFGICSRLNPVTGMPQYYLRRWLDIPYDKPVLPETESGFLILEKSDTAGVPEYYKNFTLASLRGGEYKTLDIPADSVQALCAGKMRLEAGDYLLTSGSRLKDGTVLGRISFFKLRNGETRRVLLNLRSTLIRDGIKY